MAEESIRKYLGKHVFKVENFKIKEYEIIEAPGEHNYKNENCCWFLGRLIGVEEGYPPHYIHIGWKQLAYQAYDGDYFDTPQKAIDFFETQMLKSLKNLRKQLSS